MSKTKQILLNKALMDCAAAATLDEVRSLIIEGANVNFCEYQTNMTPLMAAASRGHFEIVLFLLECGASSHCENVAGETALMIADRKGHIDTVREMICKDVEVPEALQEKYKKMIKDYRDTKLFGEPAKLEWEERLNIAKAREAGRER